MTTMTTDCNFSHKLEGRGERGECVTILPSQYVPRVHIHDNLHHICTCLSSQLIILDQSSVKLALTKLNRTVSLASPNTASRAASWRHLHKLDQSSQLQHSDELWLECTCATAGNFHSSPVDRDILYMLDVREGTHAPVLSMGVCSASQLFSSSFHPKFRLLAQVVVVRVVISGQHLHAPESKQQQNLIWVTLGRAPGINTGTHPATCIHHFLSFSMGEIVGCCGSALLLS